MEINKTCCKPLAEVFGGLETREDMRLAVMLVNRALSVPIRNGEVQDYTLEQVLPPDVLANKPVADAVKACLNKIKAENELNTIQENVRQAMVTAQREAKPQLIARVNERTQAVWNMKRALYMEGDKLPVSPPEPDELLPT